MKSGPTLNAWTTLPTASDSTNYMSQSGYLSIAMPGDWVSASVNLIRKFYIRLRVVSPTLSQVATVVQIKAQPFPGVIFLVAMDATGTLPASLQTAVSNAVQSFRGAGTSVFVTGPTITPLVFTLSVQGDLTADPIALQALVVQAIKSFMSTFTLGQEFVLTQFVQFIRNQSSDILDVTIIAPLNNQDAAFDELFQAGAIIVSVYQ